MAASTASHGAAPTAPAIATGPEQIYWDELDKTRYFILGPTMFLAVRAAVYPSNLVKTRLQVQSRANPLYSGTFDAFRKILRLEGPRGLYKGFGASTANVLTGNVYISMYELARKLFMDHTDFGEKASNFVGGACASLVSQTIVVPLDIVSQRMMISDQGVDRRLTRERARGFVAVTKSVYRTDGLRGFYRGYLPSIATYAPSSALWWGSYGLLVPKYYGLLDKTNVDPFWKQVFAQALSGGSAGILTAVLTNPMDIVRTKTQVYTQFGAIDTLKYILKRDGWRGLMTGVNARMLAMGPSGVLVISSYEFVKRMSRRSPEELAALGIEPRERYMLQFPDLDQSNRVEMAGTPADMERKFRLVDAAYCFLTRNRATLSVRNVVQMVNGLSPGVLDAAELRAMAALAPELLALHTAQQKQLTHRDDVFRDSDMAPDQLQLLAFPSVPQITARASEKRVKLFLAALEAAPPQSPPASPTALSEPHAATDPAEPPAVAVATGVPSSPWVDMLRGLDLYRDQIVHVETRPARSASHVPLSSLPLPAAVVKALQSAGVAQLYSHQHEAIAATLRGDNVVISTSTASGKSLAFNVPALTELAAAPQSTFFYLFPTKALAQDQLKSLRRLLHAAGMPERLCATFDGDTPMKARSMVIRDAQIFLTNPDIMHLTVLPKHSQWRTVLANLKLLVVDEAHMYRGVFGSHVASVFRRLFRLCALYGSNPRVICCSATIRNPEAHFRMLLPKLPPRAEDADDAGDSAEKEAEEMQQRPANFDFFYERPLRIITQDGAPTGEKIYCVWNPKVDKHGDAKAAEPQTEPSKANAGGPRKRKRNANTAADSQKNSATLSSSAAAGDDDEEKGGDEVAKSTSTSSIYQSAKIFSRLVEDQIHTILFCKGRKLSELVLMSVHSVLQESDKTKHLVKRVHTYRGGYTVEDRRRIERRLFDGELLGVIATNALELGIDIGELDCTMHLGLPTSISSLWQQAGRAGRKHTQQSLAVIVCFDAPLDQYFARHAGELFQLSPEAVSLNPHNTRVVTPHLLCAASEHPLFDTRSGLAYVDSFIFDDSDSDDKDRPTVAALLEEQARAQQIVARTDADGGGFRLHSNAPKSFRSVSLRSISEINYTVVTDDSDQHVLDQVPGELVFFQVYPTGVYLHQAQEYIITRVDVDQKLAFAKRCVKPLTYFTACRDFTAVDVVKVFTRHKLEANERHAPGYECYGNVSVTTTVFGTTLLEKRTMRVLHMNEFTLPPMQHFGHALWIELPHTLKRDVEAAAFVWAGALHGVGHLLLAVVPLFVLCDAGDINTEHYNPLEKRERPNRVTIYERRAGGSGVVEEIRRRLRDVVHRAWVIASECACVAGCPSCIHSAQCTEYNKVLDKRGSLLVLEYMARAYGLLQD